MMSESGGNMKKKALFLSTSTLEEKDDSFYQETRKRQRIARENIMRVLDEQETLNTDLEGEHKRLESWSKELESGEALINCEREILEEDKKKNDNEKQSLQLAYEEQRNVDENVLKLVEEHRRATEESLKKFDGLQRNLKQKLEMGTEQLEGKLEVLKCMGGDDDVAILQKINQLQKKEEELYGLENLIVQLITKECQRNVELQEARKELIKGLIDVVSDNHVNIGIKRVGEIDEKPFKRACKQRYSAEEADIKAVELCFFWQEKLKDPEWFPFRIDVNSRGSTAEFVVKEDDELLVELKEEWGDEVYDAVVTALKEIEDYNPGGCLYVIPVLWNFKENRKATLKEVISYIFQSIEDSQA